jgi:hypothetical protein
MNTETRKDNLPILNVRWPEDYPSEFYDLPVLIENMKRSQSWAKGDLKNLILLNSPSKQILLTAMHEKTEIDSFQISDSVSFQIIEGELMISTRKESLILKEGQLLTLNEKVKYRLKTNAETVLLLTILNRTANGAES